MPQVIEVIAAILVYDVAVVIVAPAHRPSFIVSKGITAILEAVVPADKFRMPHVEGVFVAEMGPVMVIGDATIMVAVIPVAVKPVVPVAVVAVVPVAAVAVVVSIGLALLPSGLLLSLRLFTLRRRLTLRPLLALSLLLTLRLLLVLCLLGVLWLRLVLGGLCLSLTSAFMLLAFLCECWNRGAEEHQ